MIPRFSSFAVLGILLLVVLGMPKQAADNMRACTVASLIPVWKTANWMKVYLGDRPLFWTSSSCSSQELFQLQTEVQSLRSQLAFQSDWKNWAQHLESQLSLIKTLQKEKAQDFFKRRLEEMNELMQRQFFAVLAPVIYRDPSSWSSSLWIQAGEKDNESLGRVVVAKNSPVVVGSSLVGVVEFVGAKQSRVRLITDSGLIVSVRAARGSLQDQELFQFVSTVRDRVQFRKDLPLDAEQKIALIDSLQKLQTHLGGEDGYYAKGQLQGSSTPFWRGRGTSLKGIGFNYDYGDQEGPARELRTGRPVGINGPGVLLLEEGDLLLTSGLDGVFPPGIEVGIITEIKALAEGAYSYEIEARPAVVHLNDLRTVFILPPLGS